MVNWLFRNSKIRLYYKKQLVIASCFLVISVFSFGQNNLVPNGSFEAINNCPFSFGQIDYAISWFQPNQLFSTSDLFNTCSSLSPVDIPLNNFGYQNPFFGNSYGGIYFYLNNNIQIHREYIEIELTKKLTKNYIYCIEFYVSLADSSNYAIASIGGLFSTDSILVSCTTGCLINIIPQIQNDSSNIVTDKQNWVKISGSFVASGGEQFLTIGNFYDDIETAKHSIKVSNYPNNDYAYYYIDNVSVYACDSPLVEEPQDTTFVFIPNVFSPNQDGENDLWQVTANKVNSLNVQVFNRWGEQVYKTNLANTEEAINFNPAWDGYTPTGKPLPEGTYFYIVQYTLPNGEVKVEKGHLTLLR